jgi:hypothetical protein
MTSLILVAGMKTTRETLEPEQSLGQICMIPELMLPAVSRVVGELVLLVVS